MDHISAVVNNKNVAAGSAIHGGDAATGHQSGVAVTCIENAGTSVADGTLKSSGGRVLCVTALADWVPSALFRQEEILDGMRRLSRKCGELIFLGNASDIHVIYTETIPSTLTTNTSTRASLRPNTIRTR